MTDEQGPDPEEGVRQALKPIHERQQALGEMVEWGAAADNSLRMLFCALLGSPYASIVAGGQSTSWLIENCQALIKHHRALDASAKDQVRAMLVDIDAARVERNRLIHHSWAYLASSGHTQFSTKLRTYEVDKVTRTVDEVSAVTAKFAAHMSVFWWVIENLGESGISAEGALRWIDYLESLSPAELQTLHETRAAQGTSVEELPPDKSS